MLKKAYNHLTINKIKISLKICLFAIQHTFASKYGLILKHFKTIRR